VKANVAFFDGIRELIAGARTTVARGVDLVQVHTNFEIGRRIVQESSEAKTGPLMENRSSENWQVG
jgi:hypothetical protein